MAIVNIWTNVDAELSNCSAPPCSITRFTPRTLTLLYFHVWSLVRSRIHDFEKENSSWNFEGDGRGNRGFCSCDALMIQFAWAESMVDQFVSTDIRVWLTVRDRDRLHWLISQYYAVYFTFWCRIRCGRSKRVYLLDNKTQKAFLKKSCSKCERTICAYFACLTGGL